MRAFVESTDDLVTEVDAQGRFIYVNSAALQVLGLAPGECPGLSAFDFTHPDDRERTRQSFERWQRDRVTHASLENRQVSRDGSVRDTLWTVNPQYGSNGEFLSMWSIARDITELKRTEKALLESNQELARSNQDLEQFAYVASHDLQEPLRMVAGFTQLLQLHYGEKLDDDGREFIRYAVDGATRMQRLIQDLLAYSRVGSRGNPFRDVDCEGVLKQAMANLEAAFGESGATVEHEPLPRVAGDGSQLVQLFQNLLANAIKFHGPEPTAIHVSAREVEGAVQFSVRDNGIGIESRFFDRIFVIFRQLHSKSKYAGSGVGLAICKRIVERHGGRLWVDSELGHGSTFHFTVPRRTVR